MRTDPTEFVISDDPDCAYTEYNVQGDAQLADVSQAFSAFSPIH